MADESSDRIAFGLRGLAGLALMGGIALAWGWWSEGEQGAAIVAAVVGLFVAGLFYGLVALIQTRR